MDDPDVCCPCDPFSFGRGDASVDGTDLLSECPTVHVLIP